ncbi:MAG TPA: MBL fold metallo-hydrolase [Mycobacteriales bacterium]|nr:MBL fold metallo-hydrolase [Mycobacteriales bacterium]
MNLQVVPIVDEGLGNSCYLVDVGDGRALVVDASLDVRALHSALAARGLRVAYAADTHLHADFVSGAPGLAVAEGAEVLAPAAGNRSYPHRALADSDEVDLGGLTLRALATAGHTSEHLSYLLLDDGEPVAVFTGGSLMVGTAARTDLSGEERTLELARAQYRSLQRLMTLPDSLPVYPTHGAGSFCSSPPGAERTTTIGRERATNPLLAAPDESAFVAALLRGFGSYPPYFDRLAEINRRGDGRAAVGIPAVAAGEVDVLRRGGTAVVDVRPVDRFAAGHIPGAISIDLRPAFATWLGWVLDHDHPLVIVRDADQDLDEVEWSARKIGWTRIAGEVAGGMAAWRAAGLPVAANRVVSVGELADDLVLDVRQSSEHRDGHLPGAVPIELGRIAVSAASLPPGPLAVMCGHGERAATAASLLERAGRREARIVMGGPDAWATATGRALEVGG